MFAENLVVVTGVPVGSRWSKTILLNIFRSRILHFLEICLYFRLVKYLQRLRSILHDCYVQKFHYWRMMVRFFYQNCWCCLVASRYEIIFCDFICYWISIARNEIIKHHAQKVVRIINFFKFKLIAPRAVMRRGAPILRFAISLRWKFLQRLCDFFFAAAALIDFDFLISTVWMSMSLICFFRCGLLKVETLNVIGAVFEVGLSFA